MSTQQTHPTATAMHSRAMLLIIAALVAVVVAAGAAVTTSGDNGSSTPAPPAFHLPSYAVTHGGAPVPDLSVVPLPHGPH